MTGVNCAAYGVLWKFFVNGQFRAGFECTMTGGDPTMSLFLFAMIFGAIELALFVRDGSPLQPAILAILTGGVMFGLLPATLVNIALVAALLLLGALGVLVAFRAGT
ncbi:hypothetical protein AFNJKBDN_CDS0049 [Halorubrum virus V_ICIS4]|nr:hypothetical protein AFNJKBDN_CDS0049 [Halorubrum virus V_ICIS4]